MLYFRCVYSNLFNLWFQGKTSTATLMNMFLQVPYLVLASIGLVVAVRSNQFRNVAPLALLLAYMVAVYVAILAQARYSVPLIPLVSILASMTFGSSHQHAGREYKYGYTDKALALPR